MGQILRAGLSVSSIKAEGSAAPGNSFLFGRSRIKSESPELRALAKKGKQQKKIREFLYDAVTQPGIEPGLSALNFSMDKN
jgi:hypothetical protein